MLADSPAALIARQVFETLLRFDPRTLEIEPGLAASFKVLDGGRRFVFELRDGARFHNDRPVGAQDVVFSLSRLANPATGSRLSYLLDDVVGYAGVDPAAPSGNLEGIAATSPGTVEITLTEPWYEFPYVLTNPATSVVASEELQADPAGHFDRPIGSGPYELEPIQGSADLSLSGFDNGAGSPEIGAVRLLVYESGAAAANDFREGIVDIAERPAGSLNPSEEGFAGGFTPMAAGVYLGFNTSTVPDASVRSAISRALDREAISHGVYADVMTPAGSMIPPGFIEPAPGCRLCEFDPGAQDALGGAPGLRLLYQGGQAQELMASAIAADLDAAGLEVDSQSADLPSFFSALDSGDFDMFRLGWAAEYPAAEWFIAPLFGSTSPDNRSGISDPELDALIAQARSEPDPAIRAGLYRQAAQRAQDHAGLVPIGFFRNHFIYSADLEGFYADHLGGFYISDLSLD